MEVRVPIYLNTTMATEGMTVSKDTQDEKN
jgi:hypothetical protein